MAFGDLHPRSPLLDFVLVARDLPLGMRRSSDRTKREYTHFKTLPSFLQPHDRYIGKSVKNS